MTCNPTDQSHLKKGDGFGTHQFSIPHFISALESQLEREVQLREQNKMNVEDLTKIINAIKSLI